MQLIIRLINTTGVYFRAPLGDPAFIRSPAFNPVYNAIIKITYNEDGISHLTMF